MTRMLKWLGLIVGGLVGLALMAVGTVYLIVAAKLSKTHAVAGTEVAVPAAAADVAEGERRARILGCNDGCHGRDGSHGGIFFELPDGTRVVAPDLHRLAAEYSTAELERAIRHGVKRDGTTVIGAMPSEMFYHLSDRHLGQVIAYLRSRPAGDETLPASWFGPMARGMFLYYEWSGQWRPFAAEAIDHAAPRVPPGPDDPISHGRYLATTSCTECHGADLKGGDDPSTPDLAIAAAYSSESFAHLLRTGEALGGRQLDLMALVAQRRFAHFNEREVEDLHAYLLRRAGADGAGGGAPTRP